MSRIHLNRNRQNLGQFSPEEVAVGLRSGRFLPTDLAWREGMETWQPLSTFTDLPEPEPEAELTPAPILAPGSEVLTGAAAPAGVTPAWEREGGWFARASDTVREVLAAPQTAFSGVPVDGNYLRPLLFLLLVGSVTTAVSLVYQAVMELAAQRPADSTEPAFTLGIYGVVFVLIPVLLTVGAFISAGIFHVCLMLIGVAPKSFEVTFRVVCYANGATSVMLLIPFCGGLVQSVWNLYAIIIGLREVHGITTGKAAVAVLLPLMVCCGLALGIGIFVFGAAMPSILQGMK